MAIGDRRALIAGGAIDRRRVGRAGPAARPAGSASTSAITRAISTSSSSGRRCRRDAGTHATRRGRRLLGSRPHPAIPRDARSSTRCSIERPAATRRDRHSAARPIDAIADGDGRPIRRIIVFPEGTRSLDGRARAVQERAVSSLPAQAASSSSCPSTSTNMNRILPKGELLPVPLMSRVVVRRAHAARAGEDEARDS